MGTRHNSNSNGDIVRQNQILPRRSKSIFIISPLLLIPLRWNYASLRLICLRKEANTQIESAISPGFRVQSKGRPMQALARGAPGNGQRVPVTFSLFEVFLLTNFIHQNTSKYIKDHQRTFQILIRARVFAVLPCCLAVMILIDFYNKLTFTILLPQLHCDMKGLEIILFMAARPQYNSATWSSYLNMNNAQSMDGWSAWSTFLFFDSICGFVRWLICIAISVWCQFYSNYTKQVSDSFSLSRNLTALF